MDQNNKKLYFNLGFANPKKGTKNWYYATDALPLAALEKLYNDLAENGHNFFRFNVNEGQTKFGKLYRAVSAQGFEEDPKIKEEERKKARLANKPIQHEMPIYDESGLQMGSTPVMNEEDVPF